MIKQGNKLIVLSASLTAMFLFFLVIGYFIIPLLVPLLDKSHVIITIIFFFLVNMGVLFAFFRGLDKNPRNGLLYTFAAISAKFLAYIIYILLFYLLTKNLSSNYLILFFILYLSFTIFILLALIKELKTREIKQN